MRQIVVIGLGEFGQSVAKTLVKEGCEVIAVDKNENIINDIKDEVSQAVCMDAIDEKILRNFEIQDADAVVVSIGEDIQSSLLICLLLKEIKAKFIVARAINSMHGKLLRLLKIDKIVYPELDMGIRVGRSLVSSGIFEHIDVSEDFSIVEIKPPDIIVGKSLAEANIRKKHNVSVIAVKRKDPSDAAVEFVKYIPGGDEVILENDLLIIFGENDKINAFKKLTSKED